MGLIRNERTRPLAFYFFIIRFIEDLYKNLVFEIKRTETKPTKKAADFTE